MNKARYIIAECPRCHTIIIADTRYKSKTCPKCNSRLRIEELSALETAENSKQARLKVSNLKEQRGTKDDIQDVPRSGAKA